MSKKFTQKEDEILQTLYLEYVSLKEIAECLSTSPYYISKRAKELGLGKRSNHEVIRQSNLRKYGYEFPFQSKDIQNKVKSTMLDKYGVTNPGQMDGWKEKREKTCLDRFGETNNSKTSLWKEKHDNTCLTRFGETNNSKTNTWKKSVALKWNSKSRKEKTEIVNKRTSTNLDRYGVKDINQQHINHYEEYCNFNDWVNRYLDDHKFITPSVVANYFGITLTGAFGKIYQTNTEYLFTIRKSYLEYEIENLLKSCNISYKKHDRIQIKPQELDFYIPSLGIAIEVNDIFSHSTKDRDYHLNKTLMCEDKGILLIHLWEWEFGPSMDYNIRKILQNLRSTEEIEYQLPDKIIVNMDKPLELLYMRNYDLVNSTDPKVIYDNGNSKIYDCGTREYILRKE